MRLDSICFASHQLDRLLRGDADQVGRQASVEGPHTALVPQYLLDHIQGAEIGSLYAGLQTGLDHIDRVYASGPNH